MSEKKLEAMFQVIHEEKEESDKRLGRSISESDGDRVK